jgi:hypothetical protein
MRASIILGALLATITTSAAQAQPASQQRQPPQPPAAVIIDRTPQLPTAPERQINPPRTYQDISPPMQSPTPLSPMAPRVGNGG